MNDHLIRVIVITSLISLISACAGQSPYEIEMMPAPEVYEEDGFNPLSDADPIHALPYQGVLFATGRGRAAIS
jgi:hypothetical protein